MKICRLLNVAVMILDISTKKHSGKCLTHNLWVELGDHLYSFFNSTFLDDIINNNLGVLIM